VAKYSLVIEGVVDPETWKLHSKHFYTFVTKEEDSRVEQMAQILYSGFQGRNDGVAAKDASKVVDIFPFVPHLGSSVSLKLKKRAGGLLDTATVANVASHSEWVAEYVVSGCISIEQSLFFGDRPYQCINIAVCNLGEPLYGSYGKMPQVANVAVKITVPDRTTVWRRFSSMRILDMTSNVFESRRQEHSVETATALVRSSLNMSRSTVDGFDKRIVTLEWRDIPTYLMKQAIYVQVPVRFPVGSTVPLPSWQKKVLAYPPESTTFGKAVALGGVLLLLACSVFACRWAWGRLVTFVTPVPHGASCACSYCTLQRNFRRA